MTTHPAHSSTIVLINGNGMGRGDLELQRRLISTYLQLLLENHYLPAAICFYTEGVRLVVEGSPVLDQLRSLENAGVRLVICGTCLNHYQLVEKVQVGVVGGMNDILEYQWQAEKVITL